jgi:protein-S-isoprenylcysteine O-methyltransferase Ste14
LGFGIKLYNLWIFYVFAYALALPMQFWANSKRGEPFDDPEFLFQGKKTITIAMIWLFSGLAISFFVPLTIDPLFSIGLLLYIGGLIIIGFTFYSFAQNSGLVTTRIHRYSRNPGYVGWVLVIFGMSLIGWSVSIWSVLFLLYFILTIPNFHWTVLLEEKFLIDKYGDSYRQYLGRTPRYLGVSKGESGSQFRLRSICAEHCTRLVLVRFQPLVRKLKGSFHEYS